MKLNLHCSSPYLKYDNLNIFHHIFTNKFEINNEIKFCSARFSSNFDYGWKFGKHYRLQYHTIDALVPPSKNNNIKKRIAEEYLSKIRDSSPITLREFEGLSASTNIKLERLIYLHILFSNMLRSKCTSMLATGKATKENDTFLFINLDGGLLLTTLVKLFTLKIWITNNKNSNDYKYAFMGIPILFENPLINEKGLGLGQTATICNKKRYNKNMDRDGININMLIRTTMKSCKNVNEVAELWKETKICNKKVIDEINQTTAWCDKEGGILLIEVGPDLIETVFGNSTSKTGSKEGILWHARHHQWLDGNKTGSILPGENIYSTLNAKRAQELLELNYGNIALDTCMDILRDHGKEGSDALCKHPNRKRIIFTSCSYIVNPKNLTIYLARGNPCKCKYQKYVFSKKFN